jgi:hypothetical protein
MITVLVRNPTPAVGKRAGPLIKRHGRAAWASSTAFG